MKKPAIISNIFFFTRSHIRGFAVAFSQTNSALNFFIAFVPLIYSCDSFQNKKQDLPSIAVAGETKLLTEEYNSLFFPTKSIQDSLIIAKRVIERWAENELFYKEATEKLFEEDLQITKEIEEYKKELINYRYESKLIENNLDTLITRQEIEEYYNANKDNFILKDNIVKVNYIKAPVSSKAIDKIKKALHSVNVKDKEQLKTLCSQYAENYFLNDSTWLLLDDIKKEIPQLVNLPEYNFYNNRTFEYYDNTNYYYLKIKEIKSKNTLSPINFEEKNIKTILLNLRKTNLISEYKRQLLEKAKADKNFRIISSGN